MNAFASILAQLTSAAPRDAQPPVPRPAPAPVEWGLADLVRRSDFRADPSRSIWAQSSAAARQDPDDCPHCNGVGALVVTPAEGYSYTTDCVCADLRNLVDSYNRMRLPPGFHHVTVEGTDWSFPTATIARAPIEALATGWVPGAPGLVMYGTNGSGKNHMAALACTTIATRRPIDYGDGRGPRRPIVRHIAWPVLLQEIKEGFSSKKSEAAIIAPYLNADVFWIDELGMGRQTDFTAGVAEGLLWQRLNGGQTTIITTNLPPTVEAAPRPARGQPAWDPANTLAAQLNTRVMSRMQTMTFVQMTGADYRTIQARGA